MQQTNRTILFEELNGGRENIISMIHQSGQQESLTDDEILAIHEKLLVKSFQEAVAKFEPQIFIRLDTDTQSVGYTRSITARDEGYQAIPLCREDGFFEALSEMMENKRRHRFVITSFQSFSSRILPSAPPEPFLAKRREMLAAVCRNQLKKAERLRRELVRDYDDGIFLVKTFLDQIYTYMTEQEAHGTKHCFVVGTDGNGQVHPAEISEHFKQQSSCTREEEQRYFQFLQEHMDEDSLKNRNLMVLLLNLACPPQKENVGILKDYYNSYLDFYRVMLERFWWEAKPVLCALLGIKNFFEQYPVAESGMRPALLIANTGPEFIKQQTQKEAFRLYLESVNEKNDYKDTIWYAVLPGAPFEGEKKKLVRERFQSSSEDHTYAANDSNDLSLLLELLSRYRVQCFVSAQPVAESTFHPFVEAGMDQWQETFGFLKNVEQAEFLIPCYPNFTVVPKAYSMLILGYETEYDPVAGKIRIGKAKKFWFDDLNVEASYIAAGLTAACQCPEYLKQYHKKYVRAGVPGVAYRLCEGEHNRLTVTQMFKEVVSYPAALLSEIEKYSHGMVFAPWNGKVAAVTDRVFSYRPGSKDLISTQQTMTYVERTIRHATQDFKEHLIREFFQERPGSVIAGWKEEPDCVNAVIKSGEDLKYRITEENHTCRFEISFREVKKADVVATNQ